MKMTYFAMKMTYRQIHKALFVHTGLSRWRFEQIAQFRLYDFIVTQAHQFLFDQLSQDLLVFFVVFVGGDQLSQLTQPFVVFY